MNYYPTYSLVLYTLNNDEDNEAHQALTDMLSKKGYQEEGDQSTLILTDLSKQPSGEKFLADLNKLCQKVKFHQGNRVTLINSGYRVKDGYILRNINNDLIPVMRRHLFLFNPSLNKFLQR